jgi:hypothetical protein
MSGIAVLWPLFEASPKVDVACGKGRIVGRSFPDFAAVSLDCEGNCFIISDIVELLVAQFKVYATSGSA